MHSEYFIDGTGTYQVLDGPVLRGMQKPSPYLGKTQVCYYSFLPAFKGFCESYLVCLEESSRERSAVICGEKESTIFHSWDSSKQKILR